MNAGPVSTRLREADYHRDAPLPQTDRLKNIEAEQALLGAVLINNKVLDYVASMIEGADFFYPVHGRIFEACLDLHRQGKEANPITLGPVFADDPGLVEAGGRVYLARLAGSAVTVINAPRYAECVVEMSLRRRAADIVMGVSRTAIESPVYEFTARKSIADARTKLDALEGRLVGANDDHTHTSASATTAAIDEIEAAYQRNGALPGISTGLGSVDDILGGLQAPHLIVVAGATSMGKSALALQMALAAARAGVTTLYASLEMDAVKELQTRALSAASGIPYQRLRRGRFDQSEFDLVYRAKDALAALPLHYDDRGGQTLEHITAAAKRYARQGLGLLLVDHLQLMRPARGSRPTNRVNEVSEMTAGLKALAKDINIPVVLLSQLNRQPNQREIKRPTLSDLRDSGSIEQDADAVGFLYRPEFYLKALKPDGWEEQMDTQRGKAEFIVGKNRHGPTDTVPLLWDGPTMQFGDPT